MSTPDKVQLVAEGTKWLADWLGKQDPDFKDCSIILITVTQDQPNKAAIFDMMTNEQPGMVLHMLSVAMNKVMTGGQNYGTVNFPKVTQPS